VKTLVRTENGYVMTPDIASNTIFLHSVSGTVKSGDEDAKSPTNLIDTAYSWRIYGDELELTNKDISGHVLKFTRVQGSE
jgi:hypothetical protein